MTSTTDPWGVKRIRLDDDRSVRRVVLFKALREFCEFYLLIAVVNQRIRTRGDADDYGILLWAQR